MKIALLSGAYKNAGDFLIVKRSKDLLKYVYPECSITEFERRKSLLPYLDEINRHDILILAGGPAYSPSIYPDQIPLVPNLYEITIPIFALGLGWNGQDMLSKTIKKYHFKPTCRPLFDRIEQDGFSLSCRDWASVKILKENCYSSALMTGCPAWYDLKHLDIFPVLPKDKWKTPNICISDPAFLSNYGQLLKIVDYVKKQFPHSSIKFVFHRGYKEDRNTLPHIAKRNIRLKNFLEAQSIDCVDISYRADGFKVYNECDLHIGYRVHAHIYNLSIRNPSILLEEDGRGGGVNQALALPSIRAYTTHSKIANKYHQIIDPSYRTAPFSIATQNNNIIHELDTYLFELFSNDFIQMKNAFLLMRSYFDVMIAHIRSIQEKL